MAPLKIKVSCYSSRIIFLLLLKHLGIFHFEGNKLWHDSSVGRTQVPKAQASDLSTAHSDGVRGRHLPSPLHQFSQLLEEKSVLSTQLSDASQSLRENQQHCSNLFNHCAVLEKQLQKLQAVRQQEAGSDGGYGMMPKKKRPNRSLMTGEQCSVRRWESS